MDFHCGKRLLEQKEFAFTQEMVHVENSPAYQLGVMDLFRVVAEFLDTVGDELSATLYEDIKKAGEFMTYIMKPDGVLAEIGDANCSLDTINSLDNEHLIYAASLGTEGTKPEEKARYTLCLDIILVVIIGIRKMQNRQPG